MPEDHGTIIPNPGHGTATSSVIVSPKGAQGTYKTTFAHLFEEALAPGAPAVRTRMRGGDGLDAALAALLRVPLTDLPAELDAVGQELAFHLATDPALYDRFEQAIRRRPRGHAASARARGRRAVPAAGVRTVREGLRSGEASPLLKRRLGV